MNIEHIGLNAEQTTSNPSPTLKQLEQRYPNLDKRTLEVMQEALQLQQARIETRNGTDWWIDPMFGPDTPVHALGYDETLGMIDKRKTTQKPRLSWPSAGGGGEGERRTRAAARTRIT